MKAHILPGKTVIAHFRHGNITRTLPAFFLVLKVEYHALTVADERSENGLAQIMIQEGSRTNGNFAYEYDQNKVRIARLEDEAGKQIMLDKFIQL